ncbi:hypothetical protein ACFFJ7_20365 [Pseudochelatococcus lubricantis]|uniref:hypothetical protein n=1 Tax=Pseudochelatococcus lubricantis TaxID=1538102 RepID=UPI0035EE78C4
MLGPLNQKQILNHDAVQLKDALPSLGKELKRTSATPPQDTDLRINNIANGLAKILHGSFFGLSAQQKAERLLGMARADRNLGQVECERLERALQNPDQLKALLTHKSEDCGGSSAERMSNRALLLLDLAAGVDQYSLLEHKEIYLKFSPWERKCCLNLPSAGMRWAFIDLSPAQRSEVNSLSQAERESVMASRDPEQVLHETRQHRELYERNGIPWTRDTKPAIVNGELKSLGSGTSNTVFSTKIDTPTGNRTVVIKPLNDWIGWGSEILGVQPPPHYELRNIATSLVAKSLGFDVVVDTQLCLYKSSPLHADQQVGIMMEQARGSCVCGRSIATLQNGNVQREMTKLQLVDAIVGQIDRHGSNMLIHMVDGKAVVKGIDNDQCLGRHPLHPNELFQPHSFFNTVKENGRRGVELPGVVDTKMTAAILKLRSSDLRVMLADKVNEEECDAAVARLAAVKAHLAKLASAGRIITPEEWGSSPLIKKHCNPKNSYCAREIAIQLGI